MSSGLLVSRKMKLELYHKFLISRNYEDAIINYAFYRSEYSTVNYDGVFIKNSALTYHPYPLRNADDFFLPRVRNDF